MKLLKEIKESLLQLLFPHICAGCGSDLLSRSNTLCMRCLHAMPETHFEGLAGNPVEKIFWGRLPLVSAAARYYFTRESLMQHLMHRFKYRNDKELGLQLGKLMGDQLKNSGRFGADALVPLPLFPAKEKKRGFNQSALLCEGIAAITGKPVWADVITRPQHTETQTKKGRIERWKNMEGKFFLREPERVSGKHLLLVDDVITTGATLEACGNELLRAGNVTLSVASLCFSSR